MQTNDDLSAFFGMMCICKRLENTSKETYEIPKETSEILKEPYEIPKETCEILKET